MFFPCSALLPWRWRQHVPLQWWYPSDYTMSHLRRLQSHSVCNYFLARWNDLLWNAKHFNLISMCWVSSLCAITNHYLNTGTGDAWARHNRDMADLWGVTSLLEPTLLSFSVGATLVWGSVRSYNKTRVRQWCKKETFHKGQCSYISVLWQPISINLRTILAIWRLKYI